MWVFSGEVGCNGRRMALKWVETDNLVSMVTNHPYQTHLITKKPPPPCRASCEEHSGVVFMVGGRLHFEFEDF